jgi:GTP-binding protein
MFIDETTIDVIAGDGGNGCYAFDRGRGRPYGRPNGGTGGMGGHIYVQGSSQLHTLQDIAYQHTYRGKRGDHGKGGSKHGKNGESVIVQVPLGTIVVDDATSQILVDCIEEGQKTIIAKGGMGGRGNQELGKRQRLSPDHAEYGKPGEKKRLKLVLKVLADVGLVGRPNAGKSTFLSTVSHAHPKIADYPFTTLHPHLGIVKLPNSYDSFVMADIPGLIEGSYEGKGLGIQFLRHIERTRVLALLIDASDEDPVKTAETLQFELEQYSPLLAAKPKCHILTKCDLLGEKPAKQLPPGWLWMSAATGANVNVVLQELARILAEHTQAEAEIPELPEPPELE